MEGEQALFHPSFSKSKEACRITREWTPSRPPVIQALFADDASTISVQLSPTTFLSHPGCCGYGNSRGDYHGCGYGVFMGIPTDD